jgi:hypothetical protein
MGEEYSCYALLLRKPVNGGNDFLALPIQNEEVLGFTVLSELKAGYRPALLFRTLNREIQEEVYDFLENEVELRPETRLGDVEKLVLEEFPEGVESK